MRAKQIFRLEPFLLYSLILFLPTQLGKHFWPDFSSVLGIRIDYLSPTIFLTDVIVFLLFVLLAISKVQSAKFKVQNYSSKFKVANSSLQLLTFNFKHLTKKWIWATVFVICFLLINILISGRVPGGLYSSLKLAEMSFLAYYTAKFMGHLKMFPKIIKCLGVGVIIESVLSIAQYLNQGSIGGVLYYLGERTFNASTPGIANASLNGELVLRPYGTFPHPNVLAGYLIVVMILILLANSFRKPEKELRIKNNELRSMKSMSPAVIRNSLFVIQVTIFALGSIALILSMSRVAILLWVIILGWFIIKRAIHFPDVLADSYLFGKVDHDARWILKFSKNRIKTGVVLVFVSVITSIFILSPISSRFTGIRINDEAVLQRTILNEKAIDMVKTNPLFGVGLGNFIPTLSKIQKPLSLGLYLQPVHNIFLLVAAETGLIGLALFVWFLWKTFQRVRSQKSGVRSQLLIALSAILILGLFDHYWLTLQQGQLLFAFIIGLSWASFKPSKR